MPHAAALPIACESHVRSSPASSVYISVVSPPAPEVEPPMAAPRCIVRGERVAWRGLAGARPVLSQRQVPESGVGLLRPTTDLDSDFGEFGPHASTRCGERGLPGGQEGRPFASQPTAWTAARAGDGTRKLERYQRVAQPSREMDRPPLVPHFLGSSASCA